MTGQEEVMEKSNPKFEWEENWRTTAGAWIAGERVVMHGKNILREMRGKSWVEMILLSITGKIPRKKQAELLDRVLALSGCIPDPRLWNNRIAALAGTARSTPLLGVGAAIGVSEAVIYGFQPMNAAFRMFEDLRDKRREGKVLSTLVRDRLAERKAPGRGRAAKGRDRQVDCMAGYGRPVTAGDERIIPLVDVLKNYGADSGELVQLAFSIENCLQELGYKLKLNTGGLIAAICLDQGLTERQFYYFMSNCFSPGLLACSEDAFRHPEGSFFPLRCDQISYTGAKDRRWKTDPENSSLKI